jgi:hypothetical protein
MQSLNIGDTIYLQKQNVSQLNVIKAKVLDINLTYIFLENGYGRKSKWELASGELIYLERPLKNQTIGFFKEVEDKRFGEWLFQKYELTSQLSGMVSQAKGLLQNEISMQQIGLLKGLDTIIERYQNAKDQFIDCSIDIRKYD